MGCSVFLIEEVDFLPLNGIIFLVDGDQLAPELVLPYMDDFPTLHRFYFIGRNTARTEVALVDQFVDVRASRSADGDDDLLFTVVAEAYCHRQVHRAASDLVWRKSPLNK